MTPSHQSLQSEDEVFLNFINRSPVGFYRTTADGRILLANPCLLRMLGYSHFDELRERNLEQEGFEPDYDRAGFKARIEKDGVIQGLEVTWTRADGRKVRLSENARVVRDAQGHVLYYEGFVEDITERQITLRRLRQSEQRYRQLVESLPHGLCIIQKQHIAFMNPAAIAMMGGKIPEDFVGLDALDFLREDEQKIVAARLRSAQAGEIPWPVHYQTKARRKDGSTFPAEVYCTMVTWGEYPALQLFMMDLTRMREAERERENLQAQLHQADKLTTVGQMAAGVAHEINNPIAFVLPNLELINKTCTVLFKQQAIAEAWQKADLDGLRKEDVLLMLDDCLDGMRRVRDITKDLGQFSRSGVETLEMVQLDQLSESILSMASNELRYRARIIRNYGRTPPVPLNRGRMGQVVLNLIINAAQALDESNSDDGWIRLSTLQEDREVIIEVANNGPAIPPQVQDRIFDPFFTTKGPGKGSGLGLSISYSTVKQHGGRISLLSDEEDGTRFRIHLPLTDSLPITAPQAPEGQPSFDRSLRILIIDDEAGIRRVVKRMLRAHQVFEASGLDAIKNQLLRGDDFDVLLCDLMMPDMDGADVAAWLERERPDLINKLIFITGGSFTPKMQNFLANNPRPCLEKPIDLPILLKAIEETTRSAA